MSVTSWSQLYRFRQVVKQLYPTIWQVPLVKKELDCLLPLVPESGRILEIGAGNRHIGLRLQHLRPEIEYRSCDIDRETAQDFYSLDEIQGRYDVIFAFELIEHLVLDEGFALLKKCLLHLRDGGFLLLGTPNLYHPHRYWGDVTHKTPFKYEELGGLMLMAGFVAPKAYRQYNDAVWRRWLRIRLGIYLHRYLDIDFAPTVFIVAQKPKP